MGQHGRALVLLLLVALGAVMGYVSPDDQGRSKSGDRVRIAQSPPGQVQRQRPQPLSAHDQQRLEQARRGPGAGAVPRKARDIDTGSGSSFSSAGSASYAGTSGGAGHVSGASFGYPGFQANPFMQGANQPFDFNGFFQQLQQIQHSLGQYALNQAGNNGGAGYGTGFDSNVAYNQIGANFEGASASASLGPNGGHGSAQLIPDLSNRFGAPGGESSQSGQFAAPSGGNFGVFTSSSAGSSDVNGHRQTFKTATSGVNDNGKITTFTVRDPPQ